MTLSVSVWEHAQCRIVVRLSSGFGDTVEANFRARQASVYNLIPFAGFPAEPNGCHQAMTGIRPITRVDIDVFGVQTTRAMVAITPICQRFNTASTMFACKTAILGYSAQHLISFELMRHHSRSQGSVYSSKRFQARLDQ